MKGITFHLDKIHNYKRGGGSMLENIDYKKPEFEIIDMSDLSDLDAFVVGCDSHCTGR